MTTDTGHIPSYEPDIAVCEAAPGLGVLVVFMAIGRKKNSEMRLTRFKLEYEIFPVMGARGRKRGDGREGVGEIRG